ncbi:MAG: hypothetical protein WBI63_04280 [Coriobacteriia bacterium]
MRSRTTILSVYGPVLLAAVLVLTIAPTCVMPSCAGIAVASTAGCSQPTNSQFKSACALDGGLTPSAPSQPCHAGTSDCDTTMTHGTPAAVQAEGAPVSESLPAATLADAKVLLATSVTTPQVARPDVHPPDPLGVRLTV